MQLYETIYEMKQPCSKVCVGLGGNKLREELLLWDKSENAGFGYNTISMSRYRDPRTNQKFKIFARKF